jgi:biopolymer transport protein ExbB
MQNVADTANAAAEVAANASDAVANAAAPAAEALTNTAAVEGAEAAATKFGLIEALNDGGALSWTLFLLMVIMSAVSWYILFTKLREQSKILKDGTEGTARFWAAGNLKDGATKFDKNSAYRQLVDDGHRAEDEHGKLTDPVDQHEWVANSLARSQGLINAKLSNGLAFLATVGSTAPFIGLLGTVIGILKALIKIGASGDPSIDKVAGPVGEALIMTAIGLIVAVPAVMSFNWLMRRNKLIAEQLATFANDLHGFMASNGAVRPAIKTAPVAKAAPAAAPKKA